MEALLTPSWLGEILPTIMSPDIPDGRTKAERDEHYRKLLKNVYGKDVPLALPATKSNPVVSQKLPSKPLPFWVNLLGAVAVVSIVLLLPIPSGSTWPAWLRIAVLLFVIGQFVSGIRKKK